MNILLTGGAGYIGSHTVLALLEAGHRVVVIDNLCNSSAVSLQRVEQLAGATLEFLHGDIRDRAFLDRCFAAHAIDAVIHFAGLKAVGESVVQPLAYYDNNVQGTLRLCEAMAAAGVFRLVFSSSATVYGVPAVIPISESCAVGAATSPYGRSKVMVEQILQDLAASDPRWSVALLRYFNPVGAHASGMIGEDPRGTPNNLLPYISQVAIGKLAALSVFGCDYATADGTGVRDYIHVVDLALGHLAALDYLVKSAGVHSWNLGTGLGYSVLDIVKAFEEVSGKKIPRNFAPRRPGDIDQYWAATDKARTQLGWRAERTLHEMVRDTWNWQLNNPAGYAAS